MVSAPEALERPKEALETAVSAPLPSIQTRLPPAKQLMQQEGLAAQFPADGVRHSPLTDSGAFHDRKPSQHPLNREYDRILPKMNHSPANGHVEPNGHVSMPARDLHMDARHQQRQLDALSDSSNRLAAVVNMLQDQIENVNRRLDQLQHLVSNTGNGALVRTMSDNLASVMDKVGQLDGLKMQIDVLKSEVKEISTGETASPSAKADPTISTHHTLHGYRGGPAILAAQSHPSQLPHHQMVPQHQQPIPPHQTISPPHPPLSHTLILSNAQPTHFDPVQRSTSSMGQTEMSAAAGLGGFTSINQAMKRALPNGAEDHTSGTTPIGSPKRPKLAPLEPAAYQQIPEPPHHRPHSSESHPGSSRSPTHTPRQQSYPVTLTSSASMDTNSSDRGNASSGPLSYHAANTSPRRGRGGARGRPRKSGQTHEFSGIARIDSAHPQSHSHPRQISYGSEGGYPPYPGPKLSSQGQGVFLRQTSGNAAHPEQTVPTSSPQPGSTSETPLIPHSGVMQIPGASQHMVIPGMTIVSGGPEGLGEPYAHTRKTRTKPFRNADGVLIRKDGRPDMRSQSSAANLKKVHARKDQDRGDVQQAESRDSPLAGKYGGAEASLTGSPAAGTQSPMLHSPDGEVERDMLGEKSEEEKRHEAVMKKIFPLGVEAPDRAYGFGTAERNPAAAKAPISPSDGAAKDITSTPSFATSAMETDALTEQSSMDGVEASAKNNLVSQGQPEDVPAPPQPGP